MNASIPTATNQDAPVIEADLVHKDYEMGTLKVQALRRVSVRIWASQVVAMMGPSGCGKTTLLNCLSGLDNVTSGTIKIAGHDIRGLLDRELTALWSCKLCTPEMSGGRNRAVSASQITTIINGERKR